MQGITNTIDEVPLWLSKILLNQREWPLHKSDPLDNFKCTASDYLPEYFL